MLRKWNRILAIILAIALMGSTFNSNVAAIRVYAGEETQENEDAPEVEEDTAEALVAEAPESEPEQEPDPGPGPEGNKPAEDEVITPAPPTEGENPAPADDQGGESPVPDPVYEDGGQQYASRAAAAAPEVEDHKEEGAPEDEEELDEDKEEPEEEEEEEEPVVNTITIEYIANEGGSVSNPSEEIVEGSDATGSIARDDEGYAFVNWTNEEDTPVCGDREFKPAGELLVDGAKYYANFEKTDFTVKFMVDDAEFDSRGFSKGDTLTIPSQDPFKAGYFFKGWNYDGNIITQDNVSSYSVNSDMVLAAQLEEIRIFEVTATYFYNTPQGERVEFDSQTIEIEKNALPATMVSPEEAQVEEDSDYPVYYPTQTSIQITTDDLTDIVDYRQEGAVVVGILRNKEVQYIPYEFSFKYVYMLKDLSGDGYTKVDEIEANGVKNTVVTPKVIDIRGGEFERTDSYTVTYEGQELPVYYTRANYRLEFDSNGGSYVEAKTALFETLVDISGKTPVYKGYTFGGWYKEESFTNKVTGSYKLEEDTTLYAKWTPATVGYTMVYMIENADDDSYSYLDSITGQTATVGSTVKATASSPKPSKLDTRNFTFKESSEAVVKADGSTVITVKYARKVYTLKWNGELYKTNDSLDRRNVGNASVTAKFGANISQAFNRAFMEAQDSKYAWAIGVKDNDKKIVSCETMPSVYDSTFSSTYVNVNTGVITVLAYHFSTTKKQTLNYWLENYEGDSTTRHTTYNGRTYGLFHAVQGQFNYLYEKTDFYDIVGYTQYAVVFTPNTYKWDKATPEGQLTADMYYNADEYPLTFNNYDGSNISSTQVTLGKNIQSNFTAAKNAAVKPASDATWDNWYTDSAHTIPYTGDYKMPKGLVLYANWIIPDRHISFVKIDPVTGQQSTIRTDTYKHNETAASITPESITGFTFGGWYVDSEYSEKYDFNKPLTKDISVYTYWIPDEISYTVRFVYIEDGIEKDAAPSRTERSPVFAAGDVKVVKAAAVVGMLPDASQKEITLTNGENIVTFYYQAKPNEIEYTVRYIYKDGSKEIRVAPDHTSTVSGSQTSVTVAAASADSDYMRSVDEYAPYADASYYPEEVVLSHTFTHTATDNVITFYYHPYKMGEIIVNYVDMDGDTISETVTKKMMPGGQFTISTSLGGFILNRIEDENGQTVTSTKVVATEGTVTRTVYYQKKLVIGANPKTKTYDGTPLVSTFVPDDYYVEGLKNGHRISALSFTGSQTEVGESTTTPFGAVINGSQAAGSYYVIEYKSATLTVTAVEEVIVTINADDINVVYNGEPHTAGYTIVSISNEAFREEYIDHTGDLSITSTDVIDQRLSAHFFVKEEYAKNFANVSFVVQEGGLKITPRALTVTTPTVIKTYPEPAKGSVTGDDARAAVQGWAGNDGGMLGACDAVKYNVIDDDDLVDEQGNHYYENTVGDPIIIYDEGTNPSNYYIDWKNSTMGKLIVKPRPITVKVTGHVSNPDPIVFDGQPHTVTGYDIAVDSENPDDLAYRVTGATLDYAGPGQGEITVTQGSAGNYPLGLDESGSQFSNINTNYDVTFIVVDGHLHIVPADKIVVKVTGNSDTVIYNGREQSVSGYEIEIISDPSGIYTLDKVEKPAQDSIIAAGTAADTYDMNLTEKMFSNTDDNFDVTFEIINGKLIIEKAKIEVEITGNTDTVKYNGQEQKAKGYTIDGVWLVNTADREDAKELYTAFTGPEQDAAVAAGTEASQDKYPMNLKASDFTNNDTTNFEVTFTVTDGWLKIDKLPVTVTITGNSDSKPYNGQEQSISGYKEDISSPLYLPDYYVGPAQDAEIVTAKGKDVDIYTMKVSAEDFRVSEDPVNNNFEVTFEVTPGTLEITPDHTEIEVHVRGNSATYEYDGTLKQVDGFETVGAFDASIEIALAEGKAAHAEGTDVKEGGYPMELKDEDFVATSANYSNIKVVLDEDGLLMITPGTKRDLPTAEGYEEQYDAAAHTVTVSESGRLDGDQILYTYYNPKTQSAVEESEIAPTALNVSDSIVEVTVTIRNKNYNDFVLDAVPLKITQREVTVTTYTASKKYDGIALTAPGNISGFINGETADFKVTGKALRPADGTVTNTYELNWTGTANKANYSVKENLGTLTVYDRPDGEKFKIYATPLDHDPEVYDSTEKKDFYYTLSWEVGTEEINIEEPVTVADKELLTEESFFSKVAGNISRAAGAVAEFLTDIFTIKSDAREVADTYSDVSRTFKATVNADVIADRAAINVGDYVLSMDPSTLGNFRVVDKDGADVTSQFEVVAKGTGNFKITPAPVTVTAENKTKTVRGAEPALTAKVEPTNTDLYTEAMNTIKYDLSREKGNTAGRTYKITVTGEELQGNFIVTYVPGLLSVTGGGGGGPTPTPDPTPIPDDPTPTAATPPAVPEAAVLGAQREVSEAAVLGARRGRTEDETNSAARIFAIIAAAAAAVTLLLTAKKKEEEE